MAHLLQRWHLQNAYWLRWLASGAEEASGRVTKTDRKRCGRLGAAGPLVLYRYTVMQCKRTCLP
jgi:hypothetical protein